MSGPQILYISQFDNTGYGRAATENVTAMTSVGMDVVCRRLFPKQLPFFPSKIVKELLEKPVTQTDICIQHYLPEFYDYCGQFKKNIGVVAIETNTIPQTWLKKIKTMDEVIVFNEHSRKVLKTNHVLKIPVHVIPHPLDINRFSRNFPNKGIVAKIKEKQSPFVFYTIGEFVCRKNYEGLLKAYLGEFSPSDNTLLVIKTHKAGWTPENCLHRFTELINHVKQHLKLYSYPEIKVITDFYNDEQLDQLHYESDCFISTSHGEAFCFPAMDAMGFAKTPIVPNHTSFSCYNEPRACFLVKDVYEESCYGANDVERSLYTGYDSWYGVNISEVRKTMRQVYNSYRQLRVQKSLSSSKAIEKFSYERVGKLFSKLITPNNGPQI